MIEALETLRRLLELGFPAIVLIQLYFLWRAYERSHLEHIRDLRYIASIRHTEVEGWEPSLLGEKVRVNRDKPGSSTAAASLASRPKPGFGLHGLPAVVGFAPVGHFGITYPFGAARIL